VFAFEEAGRFDGRQAGRIGFEEFVAGADLAQAGGALARREARIALEARRVGAAAAAAAADRQRTGTRRRAAGAARRPQALGAPHAGARAQATAADAATVARPRHVQFWHRSVRRERRIKKKYITIFSLKKKLLENSDNIRFRMKTVPCTSYPLPFQNQRSLSNKLELRYGTMMPIRKTVEIDF